MQIIFPEIEIQKISELLSTPKRIVITTHHRPDGDAMGSSLGLYNYLIKKGHTISVLTPSDYPDFLKWMPGNDLVINYEESKEKSDKLIEDAEVLFCLDYNWFSRVENMEQSLRNASAIKILIDHHLHPEPAFSYSFSFPQSCSTSELIIRFMIAMGDERMLDKAIAESLYCGIMTDTNSFRYASMTSEVHKLVALLMDAGAENYKIHERVYDVNSENRLRLLGYCLKDKMQFIPEYNTAYIALSDEELAMFNFRPGDTEGIVNYALSIEGVILAAFFSEKDGIVKISFRSKDDFSVQELSSKYFNGGGHRNASGGRSDKPIKEAVNDFLNILPFYKAQLVR